MTVFLAQNQYLEFLEHTNTSIASGTLLSCQHCSSQEITFPSDFPFGGYYHQSAYVSFKYMKSLTHKAVHYTQPVQVGTDGYITFGQPLIDEEPEAFPPDNNEVFWTYMVAPFWANFDTTQGGIVSWSVHTRESSLLLVTTVDDFITNEYGDSNFEGSWMLLAFWENVQPSDNTIVSIERVQCEDHNVHL